VLARRGGPCRHRSVDGDRAGPWTPEGIPALSRRDPSGVGPGVERQPAGSSAGLAGRRGPAGPAGVRGHPRPRGGDPLRDPPPGGRGAPARPGQAPEGRLLRASGNPKALPVHGGMGEPGHGQVPVRARDPRPSGLPAGRPGRRAASGSVRHLLSAVADTRVAEPQAGERERPSHPVGLGDPRSDEGGGHLPRLATR
jgi:hypothetical protein